MSGICCENEGLGITNMPYIAFADASDGTGFSLGTPLSTSKYVGWVVQSDALTPPSASAYTGKWYPMYGVTTLGNEYFNVTSTLTTEETLGTITGVVPAALFQDDNVIHIYVDYLTTTLSANSKILKLKFGAVNIYSADMNDVLEQFGFLHFIISRTSATTLSTRVIDNYYDATRIKTRELFYNNITSTVPNMNTLASTITITGTSATAPDALTLGRVTVEYMRS